MHFFKCNVCLKGQKYWLVFWPWKEGQILLHWICIEKFLLLFQGIRFPQTVLQLAFLIPWMIPILWMIAPSWAWSQATATVAWLSPHTPPKVGCFLKITVVVLTKIHCKFWLRINTGKTKIFPHLLLVIKVDQNISSLPDTCFACTISDPEFTVWKPNTNVS